MDEPGTMNDVYVVMCADVLHVGHVNILRAAAAYGRVVVGLLSDEAVKTYKRPPFVAYEEREQLLRSIRWVGDVVRQDIPSPAVYVRRLKPRYFVHGDDWRASGSSHHREAVIEALKSYGGTLVEIPYTAGISSTSLQARLQNSGIRPCL